MAKNLEWVYGLHAVKTLLNKNNNNVKELIVQKGREDSRVKEIITLANKFNVSHKIIVKSAFEEILGQVNHQGVAVLCRANATAVLLTEQDVLTAVSEQKSLLLLVLDEVQDPHNLGACLRSANAMGVYAVITPKDRAASVTDTVRKVACGAAEHTPVVAVANLQRFLEALKAEGLWLVGLDAEGASLISEVDLKGRIAIVMGNEGNGLRRLTKTACDYLVKIPMQGIVESLNVSVATGIALYEVIRQRQG